jgi:uncharacterized protein (DUF58 family)
MGARPLFDEEFLKKVAALRLRTARRGAQAGEGAAGILNITKGFDLRDTRPYAPGDDLRALDWNALARLDTAVIRRFEDSAPPAMTIYIDTTASMDFGEPPKSLVARLVAGGLGALAIAEGMEVRTPGSAAHRRHSTWLTHVAELPRSQRPFAEAAMPSVATEFVLLGDLYDSDALRSWIGKLRARRWAVVVAALWSREDREAPASDAEVVDSESGLVRRFDEAGRAAFERRFREFEDSWRSFCKHSGAAFVPTATEEGWERALERILESRPGAPW